MSDKDLILEQLNLARQSTRNAIGQSTDALEHINVAYDLVNGSNPPEPPVGDWIPVKNGDNLIAMIANNPPKSQFLIANDFRQDVNGLPISKPCYLKSETATLIGDLGIVSPDVKFQGLIFNGFNETILSLGDGNIVDTCLFNGNPNGQHRGILANAKDCTILNTRVLNIFKDIDTQAIAAWDRTLRLSILNCELEASGENILIGGASASSESNIPFDISINNNKLMKKESWRNDPRATCKNLFEIKNGKNIKFTNNKCDYSPVDGQSGYGLVITPRNQDGDNPFTVIEDVLIENNDFTRVAGGVNILGYDYIHPSKQTKRITLRKNRFEVVPEFAGPNGRLYLIGSGPKDVVFEENVFNGGNYIQGQYFDDPTKLCEGLVYRKNFFIEGEYGLIGTGAPSLGEAVLNMYAPGYVWDANIVQRSNIRFINWPPSTILVG